MTHLVPLHFDIFDVRTVIFDGEPWWVGIDITTMLEVRDGHQALARLEDYERGMYNVPTPSGDQEMVKSVTGMGFNLAAGVIAAVAARVTGLGTDEPAQGWQTV